jgi:hypothetical protein
MLDSAMAAKTPGRESEEMRAELNDGLPRSQADHSADCAR